MRSRNDVWLCCWSVCVGRKSLWCCNCYNGCVFWLVWYGCWGCVVGFEIWCVVDWFVFVVWWSLIGLCGWLVWLCDLFGCLDWWLVLFECWIDVENCGWKGCWFFGWFFLVWLFCIVLDGYVFGYFCFVRWVDLVVLLDFVLICWLSCWCLCRWFWGRRIVFFVGLGGCCLEIVYWLYVVLCGLVLIWS